MGHAMIVDSSRRSRGGPGLVPAVAAVLERAGWNVDARVATDLEELRRYGREGVEAGVDAVVAVGGDGTVLQIASSLVGTQTPLAIIPAGTGNLLAGNLGIPLATDAAAANVARGRERRIDLGLLANGQLTAHFAVAAGVGFDARVMRSTPSGLKARLGKLAYVVNAVVVGGTIRDVEQLVSVDGTTYEGPAAQIFVANFGQLTARVRPRWTVEPDDGLLDVFIAHMSGPVGAVLAAWEAFHPGQPRRAKRVRHLQGRHIGVVSSSSQPVEIDGDLVSRTPIEISVVPQGLSVLVPAR
jgi:diacylglycerol kinase (ATP)